MSEHDVLDAAVAALREQTAQQSDASTRRAAATRRAILLAAPRRYRRSVIVRLVLPLAAVLAVSTAWAAVSGRLPRLLHAVTDPVQHRSEPRQERGEASSTPAVAATAAPTDAASELTDVVASAIPPRPSVTSRASSTAVDPEEPLYRAAHAAHFVERDPARALQAWDEYLRVYPHGRYAPEARYNRAVTLVRLDRRDEARAALRPFADGAFESYRQTEAKQLLEALE